jgi:monoterpene epsilon-lactone hydrolase
VIYSWLTYPVEKRIAAAKQIKAAGLDAIELSGGLLTSPKLSPSRPNINTTETVLLQSVRYEPGYERYFLGFNQTHSKERCVDQPTEQVFKHLRALADQAFRLIHDIDARRKLIEQYFCVHPSTADIHGHWFPSKAGPVPMEWIAADDVDPDRRILYMHGGSWISGSSAGYRAFLSRVSQASNAVVLSVDYRLAPEHKFPAGLDDCLQAYQWMRQNGPEGDASVASAYLMGDSAGGNLALASLLKIKDDNLPLPEAVIAISPATDFTGKSPSLVSRASVDPIVNPRLLLALIPIYLGWNTNPTHPYASPLFGDYSQMPPMLLQVGDAEVLLNDSTRLAKHASEQGCEVTLDVWEGMPHVFQGFAPFLPQASKAITTIGEFVREH